MVIILQICKLASLIEHRHFSISSSGSDMALTQFFGFLISIGVSFVGGIITGLIIKLPCIHRVNPQEFFDDTTDWEINPNYEENEL